MKKILIILVIAVLASSCRSKKKAVERESASIEIEASELETTFITENLVLETIDESVIETIKKSINENEDIEADSTGIVTVTVEKTPTGFKKTYTGIKSVKVSSNETNETKSKNQTVTTDINANKTTNTNNESVIKIKSETDSRKTDVEIKSTSTWFWIILAIIIVVYLVGRKFKVF